MDAELDAELMNKLRQVSVATLTTVLYKRGFRNQFIHGVGPINPDGRRMVGPAYTVRTIPSREDKAVPSILSDRAYPGRAAIEACPAGLRFGIRQPPGPALGVGWRHSHDAPDGPWR